MLFTIFGQLVQQIMPLFVTQRALYEVRERPSKTYSWKAFMLSNIFVEIPYNLIGATLLFFTWYYPIGLYANAAVTDTVTERGALMWLFVLAFLLFSSTFAHMVIAGIDTAETGGNIANLMFSLSLIFCGVLAGPSQFPGFWIWMYRVSPFTYLVEGMLTTAVKDASVYCLPQDFYVFPPPAGQSCESYLGDYFTAAGGGYLQDPSSTTNCSLCQLDSTNVFLAGVSLNPNNSWRDFGIMFAYIIFNIFAALALYWLLRMPKNKKGEKQEKQTAEPDAPEAGLATKASNSSGSDSAPVKTEKDVVKRDRAAPGYLEPIKTKASSSSGSDSGPSKMGEGFSRQDRAEQGYLEPIRTPADAEKGLVYDRVVV